MLRLERHLTEDELLALRDGRKEDYPLIDHLEGCPRCRRRLGFLSAFKDALKSSLGSGTQVAADAPMFSLSVEWSEPDSDVICRSVRERVPPRRPPADHPDPGTLAAYFDGALKGGERDEVRRHLVSCERCMADVLVLVEGKREGRAGEELRAAREYFRNHGSSITYEPGSARPVRPQLELGLVDRPGEGLIFSILARPGRTARGRQGRRSLDDRIEVMVGTARVTVTAHRDERNRHLDVHVRDLGARGGGAATVSLEEGGRPLASVRTDEGGKASLAVPDLPSFDLRVDGGWMIPVLLRFHP